MARLLHKEWDVRASKLSLKTHNPIRDIVERLKIKPNPDKSYIPLSVGDPTAFGNLQPPTEINDIISDIVRQNDCRKYGPTIGHEEARRAVAEYSVHQGFTTADDVILCSGCSHAVEITLTTIADVGQNILIPRPGYLIYKTQCEGLGITLKYYDLLPSKNFEVDLQSLESQIDEYTAAIVVINPSNPCGSVYSKKHLKEIIDIAFKYRMPIIADEVYEQFVFSGQEFYSLSSLSQQVPVITCSGISKRFLLPGWRLGWIIIHDRQNILGKEVRSGMFNMSARILGPNTLIQKALPRILKEIPQSFFKETMAFIESQAKLVYQELRQSPGLQPIMPQGSMYMLVEIKMTMFPTINSELEFVKLLCNEQAVLCIPGQCFNYPNFMRIVLTPPEEILREACHRILTFCQEHITISDKIKEYEKDAISLINDDRDCR